MKIFVGLGNPGRKYKKTRHNIGFQLIDNLIKEFKIKSKLDKKHNAEVAEHIINGERCIFVKPYTYMNLSGQSVRSIMDYYKVGIDSVYIIYDDMDLPTGKIRLRTSGGPGGHNGIKSIISHLGTKDFKRIRIGIAKSDHIDTKDYVLGKFTKQQKNIIEDVLLLGEHMVNDIVESGFDYAMNKYN